MGVKDEFIFRSVFERYVIYKNREFYFTGMKMKNGKIYFENSFIFLESLKEKF